MADTVPAQQQEADGGGVDNFMQMVEKVTAEGPTSKIVIKSIPR